MDYEFMSLRCGWSWSQSRSVGCNTTVQQSGLIVTSLGVGIELRLLTSVSGLSYQLLSRVETLLLPGAPPCVLHPVNQRMRSQLTPPMTCAKYSVLYQITRLALVRRLHAQDKRSKLLEHSYAGFTHVLSQEGGWPVSLSC
jgi:hypothetical protein